VLDRIETETEGIGEASLGHLEALSDAFHIDLGGQSDFIASRLSGKKGIDFVQSGHQVFKDGFHRFPPVLGKNLIGVSGQLIAFLHGQVFFFILRIGGDEEDRKGFAAKDVNYTRPPRLPMPRRATRTLRNPPVPCITSPHSGFSDTMATILSRSD
jgi:hypothetical protein